MAAKKKSATNGQAKKKDAKAKSVKTGVRKSKTKKTKSSPGQTFIAGTEPPLIKSVESAAKKVLQLKNREKKLKDDISSAMLSLLEAMTQSELDVYDLHEELEGKQVVLDSRDAAVKIKKKKKKLEPVV